MKRISAVILALFMLASLAVCAFASDYRDVPDEAWYAPYVAYVSEQGIFRGVGGGQFLPDGVMTRAMVVAVLYRMDGEKPVHGTPGFQDVPRGSWYTDAVTWGVASGVVRGYSAAAFGPEDPVTREQVCTMIARYAAYSGKTLPKTHSPEQFADAYLISGYAVSAVSACQQAGLIKGVGNGRFAPQSTATRAQVAAILTRWLTASDAPPAPTDPAELPIDVNP